jgi:hypothetical protein
MAVGHFTTTEWMRWKTYNRYEQQFDRYEEILDYGCAELATKLTGLILE